MCNVVFTTAMHCCILGQIYQIHVQSTEVSEFPRYFALNEPLKFSSSFQGTHNYENGYKTQLHFLRYGNYSSNVNFETQIPRDVYEGIRKFKRFSKKLYLVLCFSYHAFP